MSGYQPLVHEFSLEAGDTLTLRFILLATEPVRPAPETLGLEYQFVPPPIPEEQAHSVRKKYDAMAEVFAIIPFTQGIMAAVTLGWEHDYLSTELTVTGLVLSVGSYLLGRHMESTKLEEIRKANIVLNAQKLQAEQHNADVEAELKRVHALEIHEWQAEAPSRGRVEVSN